MNCSLQNNGFHPSFLLCTSLYYSEKAIAAKAAPVAQSEDPSIGSSLFAGLTTPAASFAVHMNETETSYSSFHSHPADLPPTASVRAESTEDRIFVYDDNLFQMVCSHYSLFLHYLLILIIP